MKRGDVIYMRKKEYIEIFYSLLYYDINNAARWIEIIWHFADVFKCYYRKNSVRKFVYFILSTLTNYLDELDIP